MPAPHRILLLAFPNGQLLDIAGPLQMFAGANDELSRQVYRIEIAAPQAGPFATSSGVRLVADASFVQITNKRRAHFSLSEFPIELKLNCGTVIDASGITSRRIEKSKPTESPSARFIGTAAD
jgi:transcriptional regulator GlxA family with amidase domain